MTANLGEFSLSFAVLAALAAVLAALAGVRFESARAMHVARWLIGAVAGFLTLASVALVIALLRSDFSIQYVASYTESALPWGYKLAAFWAGQAGSLLTWAVMLAWFSVLFVVTRRRDTGSEAAGGIVTIALVNAFFIILMMFADQPATATTPDTLSNPFRLAAAAEADGRGLNPLLQDPAMIAHPPTLFLGYAGVTFPFALLVGALVAGRKDNQWIAATRRWLLASWLFLTIGIILGSWWAYIELGWGGYWGWDPVENASLLPWLTATAAVHSIMAQQHRGMFKIWNAVLIATSFILCIFGTYVTRSGVIDSVHSFGKSPIGNFFLVFMVAASVFIVAMLFIRRRELASEQKLTGLIGKEGAFLATNVLLVGMMLVTMVGTMLPVITRSFGGQEMTVKAPFYNKVVAPMGMLLVALMATGPLLTYGREAAGRLLRNMIVPAILGLVAVGAALSLKIFSVWALAAVFVVAVGVASILFDLVKAFLAHERSAGALIRLIDANHRRYGGQLVHIGVMMVVAGIVGSSVFQHKEFFELSKGQEVDFAGNKLKFVALDEDDHVNYTVVWAEMLFTDAKGKSMTLVPQKRFYHKHMDQPNTQVSLDTDLKRDIYLTLGGWEPNGSRIGIEAIINPLVSWFWIGGIVMTVGAVFCMVPRLLPQPAPIVSETKASQAAGSGRLSLTASS